MDAHDRVFGAHYCNRIRVFRGIWQSEYFVFLYCVQYHHEYRQLLVFRQDRYQNVWRSAGRSGAIS